MKTYAIAEARAELSKLVDRALKGEPQRVTRYGKEAVVIVSEVEWNNRRSPAAEKPGLGTLLARMSELFEGEDLRANRPWIDRPLGKDIE